MKNRDLFYMQVDDPGGAAGEPEDIDQVDQGGQVDDDYKAKYEASAGRLAQQERKATAYEQALSQAGLELDDSGQVRQVQQYTPPAPVAETEGQINPYALLEDPKAFAAYIQQEANKQAAQQLGLLAPLLDTLSSGIVKQEYSDYGELEQDIAANLKLMGYGGIAHAKLANPGAINMAVMAARGKRATTQHDAEAEVERQAMIANGGAVGSGTGNAGGGSRYDLTSEEKAYIAEKKKTDPTYSEEVYTSDEPAVVGRRGNK